MRFKKYNIISRAIEEGLECGWNRAHKHEECPPKGQIVEHLMTNIMHALDEVIDFDEVNEN